MGIRKIKLTGGEPLLRRDIAGLVSMLHNIEGIREIAATTNGILLDELAFDLKKAGLDRVNISLDTMNPQKYANITRGGDIYRVFRGIDRFITSGRSRLYQVIVPLSTR